MPTPAGALIVTLIALSVASGSTPEPFIEITALRCEPPTLPPPEMTTFSRSIRELALSARSRPHPGAALLFYEYLLGPDGQGAMAGLDYVPTNVKVASPLKGVKIVATDPVRSLDESGKWSRLFEDTVLNKAGR